MKHRFLVLHLVILSAAFFSFQYFIERLLTPIMGMGWAFLIDQTVPLIIALIAIIYFNIKGTLKFPKIKRHLLPLVFIFLTAFITHLWTLNYFFWSDEVVLILDPITNNKAYHFHINEDPNMRGYFMASYAFLYLIFGVDNPWVYPFFSILLFTVSALFVYWFIYLLTNKKGLPFFASLFFVTTPVFLDMFTWHSTGHAPILIFGLISFISLLYYKQSLISSQSSEIKKTGFIYYLISLMFFFVAIKMGFVRSAGLTFIPLLLLLLPLYNKKNLLQTLQLVSPYIAIAVYFVLFEFLNIEIRTFIEIFIQTGSFNEAFHVFSDYRKFSQNPYFILPKLSFFSAQLFIPGGLAAEVLTPFHNLFKASIALSLGNLTLLGMFLGFIFAFKHRQSKFSLLIIFALSFIILNMLHTVIGYQAPEYFHTTDKTSVSYLDKHFTEENAGYGPGSRYLYISSVGLSLLFGILIIWVYQKFSYKWALILCIVIISSNTYFLIHAQTKASKGMSEYRSLVEHIFRTVPRNGEPKVLFSANPEKNGLDTKFHGWTWMHGFYKETELIYTKDPGEVNEFIKNRQIQRENLYAFYNNPQTLAFTDISNEARNHFYQNRSDLINIEFQSTKEKSAVNYISIHEKKVAASSRAVIESTEINQQIITEKLLKFRLKIQRVLNPPLPFSDMISKNVYNFNFPFGLWERIALPPKADLPTEREDIQTKLEILSGLQERDDLMADTSIYAPSEDPLIIKSLINEIYTSFPRPRDGEISFNSNSNPLTLTLFFPYITDIKRILLNTPSGYSSMAPSKVTIFSSSDNNIFKQVVSMENLTPEKWSPNQGKMFQINLPDIIASSLRLEISGSASTIALDEIEVDSEKVSRFSPQDTHKTITTAYHFVDNQELLQTLFPIKRYDRLTLLYACAEDYDWQQQLKDKIDLVPGIWSVVKMNISPDLGFVDYTIPINCHGSKLRKIFFVSPSYPVEIELIEAMIK